MIPASITSILMVKFFQSAEPQHEKVEKLNIPPKRAEDTLFKHCYYESDRAMIDALLANEEIDA